MAITFDIIRKHLDQAGIKYSVDESKNLAYFGVSTEDDELGSLTSPTFVTLQEDGEFIQFRSYLDRDKFKQESTKNSPHRAALLQHLMYLNYTRKIGRWCFDPDDGDLYIDHGLPVEDNEIVTFRQFERLRGTLPRAMFEAMPEIKRVLETGNAEKLDSASIILEAIQFSAKQSRMDLVQRLSINFTPTSLQLAAMNTAVKSRDIDALAKAIEI